MKTRDGGIPLYTQVAETLRRRIHVGDYREGSPLPSTEELEREFGVSEITIRKALGVLVDEGMLERKRGRGTFVAQLPKNLITMELTGSLEHLVRLAESLPTDLVVLDRGVVACPNHVADALALEAGTPVWRLQKVRCHEGSPFCHYVHYCRPELGRPISRDRAEKKNFVDLFKETTGVGLASIEQRLEATSADAELAEVLHVRFGAPLLFVENLYASEAGQNVLLTQIHYRADRCTVRSTISL